MEEIWDPPLSLYDCEVVCKVFSWICLRILTIERILFLKMLFEKCFVLISFFLSEQLEPEVVSDFMILYECSVMDTITADIYCSGFLYISSSPSRTWETSSQSWNRSSNRKHYDSQLSWQIHEKTHSEKIIELILCQLFVLVSLWDQVQFFPLIDSTFESWGFPYLWEEESPLCFMIRFLILYLSGS